MNGAVGGVLKPLRWPALWVGLWSAAVLVVVVGSLTPPVVLELPRNSDKVQHFLAYGLLAASAVQLFADRQWRRVGLGLVLLGVALEFAQGALTDNRQADPWDALANSVGVLLGLAVRLTPAAATLLRLEAWVARRLR